MHHVVPAAHDRPSPVQQVLPDAPIAWSVLRRAQGVRVGNRPNARRRRHQRFAVGSNILADSRIIGYYGTVRIGDDSVVDVQRVVSLKAPGGRRRARSSSLNVWSVG